MGVTASTKHYTGVVSAKQTIAHISVSFRGMGTEMVEIRFPTLNILDAIWVNANPAPSFVMRTWNTIRGGDKS